jgi:hypothetical protein
MPFDSKAQMRAAFGGYLGKEMKDKAQEFAAATPNIKSLPQHVGDSKKKVKVRVKKKPKS